MPADGIVGVDVFVRGAVLLVDEDGVADGEGVVEGGRDGRVAEVLGGGGGLEGEDGGAGGREEGDCVGWWGRGGAHGQRGGCGVGWGPEGRWAGARCSGSGARYVERGGRG